MQVQDTKSSGVVNKQSTSDVSEFEQQRIKNDTSFQLIVKSHILGNALIDRRLNRTHRYIIYAVSRGMRVDKGGISSIDRDAICEHLQVSRSTLRKKLWELKEFGYIQPETAPRGKQSDVFVFGDSAVDHKKITAEYLQLVGAIEAFCEAKKLDKPWPPATTTVAAHDYGQKKPNETVAAHGSNVEKPSPPAATVACNQPTGQEASLYIEESISKDIDDADRVTPASDQEDLLEGEDAPPRVEIRVNKNSVSYLPLGSKKRQSVTLHFLRNHAPKDESAETLLDFSAKIVSAFYEGAISTTTKEGKPKSVHGIIAASFNRYKSGDLTPYERWKSGQTPALDKDMATCRNSRGEVVF